jgi:tryptophan halogenase
MLARALTGTGIAITVVESPQIGTIAVGEATIPPIRDVLRFLDIDEADFAVHTHATFKLGIRFTDWRRRGHAYWHPFGTFGAPVNRRPFFHAWQRAAALGMSPHLPDYSVCAALAVQGRFRYPEPTGDAAGVRYAFHFDAGRVAEYLGAYAGRLGVSRWLGTVVRVDRRAGDGFLEALVLEDGRTLAADLFLDCSGFRGRLIEEELRTGYHDWRAMLPCDRAVAMQTPLHGPRDPFTESIALEAGWRWKIPLRNRVGNGLVYASAQLGDDEALGTLVRQVGNDALREPKFIRFTPGRRRSFWNRNCVALGLASGFLEPLESTSIHLITSGIFHLLDYFPDRNFVQSNIDAYNRDVIEEFERIRDFIVMHYCLTERDDSPFWKYCRSMPLPESLAERIALYRGTGRIRPAPAELFNAESWFYVLDGMGVLPSNHDPLLDALSASQLSGMLGRLSIGTARAAAGGRKHDDFFPEGERSRSESPATH